MNASNGRIHAGSHWRGAVLVSLPGPAVIYERTLTKLSGCVFIGLGLSAALVGTAVTCGAHRIRI